MTKIRIWRILLGFLAALWFTQAEASALPPSIEQAYILGDDLTIHVVSQFSCPKGILSQEGLHYTLTVTGGGTLMINGESDKNALRAHLVVVNANVIINSDSPSEFCVDGNITVISGSVTVNGGCGVNGAIRVYGGNASVTSGTNVPAVSGSVLGGLREESTDGRTWSVIHGSTSSKPHVRVDSTVPVPYLAWDDTANRVVERTGDQACKNYTFLTADTTTLEDGRWYLVGESMEITNRIKVNGTANLILIDGMTLTAGKGIDTTGATLNIHAQSDAGRQTGKLTVPRNADDGCAGIGGSESNNGGTVNIHGGTINVNGGKNASGIGCGNNGHGGAVNIYGGTVRVTGGENAPGIGGSGAVVTICGGTIEAKGSGTGTGITGNTRIKGGEVTAEGRNGIRADTVQDITITGGTVTAKGGILASGIVSVTGGTVIASGSGEFAATGITGEKGVSISGGEITASISVSGQTAQNAIYAPDGSIMIDGGTVSATAAGTYCNGISAIGGITIQGGTVTAVGPGRAINGSLKNTIRGTGWDDTDGTAGKAVIGTSTEGRVLAYRKVRFPQVGNPITAAAENVTAVYDGRPHGITVSVTVPASGASVRYGKTQGTYDLDTSPTITDVKDSPLTVYYRVTADDYQDLTGSATVTVSRAEAAVNTIPEARDLIYSGRPQALVTAGEAAGGTMQYALGTADAATESYSEVIPSGSGAGTYHVWYKVMGDSNHNDVEAACVKAEIRKSASIPATVIANPLICNGSAQALVSVDAARLAGGTMQYALGRDDRTAPAEGWSASIPTGTDAKTYHVWYQVRGDSNHTDSQAACVTVVIQEENTVGEAVFTPLEGSGIRGVDISRIRGQMAELAALDDASPAAGQVKNVRVSMNVRTVSLQDVPDAERGDFQTAANGLFLSFDGGAVQYDCMEITVEKTVVISDVDGNGSRTESKTLSSRLSRTEKVIDIPVHFDLTGGQMPVVARHHNGAVQVFTRLDARPDPSGLADGTYYVEGSGRDTIIHIYADRFSHYAILTYRNQETKGTGFHPELMESSTDPSGFDAVAVPVHSFSFRKEWQGGSEDSIDFTLYRQDGTVYRHGFNKRVVNSREWKYEAWFSEPVACYVIEEPIPGYTTRYVNVGVYERITDRCCDGGTIINRQIPKTGDGDRPVLWTVLALSGMTGIIAILVVHRRRKSSR